MNADSQSFTPATRLSPSYTLFDAFGDFTRPGIAVPTTRQVERARQLACQIEMLREIAGGRPLEARAWAAADNVPHPEGEAHRSGAAVDLIAPRGLSDTALAHQAHQLGFFRVIKLGGDLVHVEIGEGPQHPLTRVARNSTAPRAEHDGVGEVDGDTPTVRMMQRAPVEAMRVLVRIARAEAVVEPRNAVAQLLRVWDAVDRLDTAPEIKRALVLAAVGLGLTASDTYYAFGPRWWQAEISQGRRVPATLVSTGWAFCAPSQWGRLGAWQTLRSTAIRDGFPTTEPWTTAQHVRADGVVDPETGKDAGALVGAAQGPLADLDVAADYAARAMTRLLAEHCAIAGAVRAFYEENAVENIVACMRRVVDADHVLARIHDVRARAAAKEA